MLSCWHGKKKTGRDNWRKVEVKALVKTLPDTLAEVKAKAVCDRLADVDAEAVVETTADMVPEVRVRIISTC